MKFIKYISVVLIIFLAVFCSKNSQPTSPHNVNLLLTNKSDSVEVEIKSGQSVSVNQSLVITFDSVSADSRCPMDAMCVWPGDGEVKLSLSIDNITEKITLHTFLAPKERVFKNYRVVLKKLDPYPISTSQIKPEDYNITLIIRPVVGEGAKNVRLIDEHNSSLIKTDLLNVNSVSLKNDELRFHVEYSGGCRTHEIELYAYRAIMKSNPPQVTLRLSHNSDGDVCKALITKEAVFDLNELKDYLVKNHGVYDKVLLIIFDSSGRPIRSPALEYFF